MNTPPPNRPSIRQVLERQSQLKVLSVIVVATAVGLVTSWVTIVFSVELFNLHVAVWTFLVVWSSLVGYFAFLHVPSRVVGTGLYLIGLSLLLKPPVTFTRRVGDAAGSTSIVAVQGVSDLFFSLLVFGVTGLFVIGLGRYFRRRGERTVARKMRRSLKSRE